MSNPCSVELLESALVGELPPEREELLHRHLAECEACSAALEQLAGGEAWRQELAATLTGDELDDALSARDEWSGADFTVEHLEPADEPGVLGRLGGYDVLEIIGRGGMGVVLKGFDPELKRCVAIKVLSPHLAASSLARKRFAREAQAAAAVVHPNVLAIHQVQPAGRLPFLVMPLVAGESLAQRLTAEGRLELKETLRIGMQAAAGLSAAHEQGLVHRDVKPANILLEKGVERVVLTDFGLARAADDVSMTRWGIIAGTPQYMSPEQAKGEPLDGRSDLFSLGCVLYEMATGVSPFRADSTLATLRRLIDDPPPAMASHDPELPPWFVGIVERLLEKEPSRRFGSAKEVSELLEGCLAHVQQPAGVPLPAGLIPDSNPKRKRGPDANTKRQRGLFRAFLAYASGYNARKRLILGAFIMLGLIGISLFAVGVLSIDPPDIAGQWTGEGWGQVTLTQTAPGQYTGTYTDAVAKEKEPGKIDLKWSRIERRFNGTWSEGEDRFGDLSIRLADQEIRGALTTDAKSKINPATPRLADLTWIRSTASPEVEFPSEKSKVSLPPYRIEPPDVLQIELLKPTSGAASLTGPYLVGPDGTINLRRYGVVHMAGKTMIEARRALQKHLAQYFDSPEVSVDIAAYNSKVYYVGKGVKLELVLIPAGEFLMGSPDSDSDASSDEKPQHRVRITKPFYLGKFPVTQEQWEAIMPLNPSQFKGAKNPVDSVRWDDCQAFLSRLNEKFAKTAGKFALPTEAQWEYACRAGSTTYWNFGNSGLVLGDYAWYSNNSESKTHPVGEKKPNAWGLYDMNGNVWEWCQDWYDGNYYAKSPMDDPTGPATGSIRVSRGGGWNDGGGGCRSANRGRGTAVNRLDHLGLRVSLVPAEAVAATRSSSANYQPDKTSAAKPTDEVSPASDQSATKEGAKTESKPATIHRLAAEPNTGEAKAIAEIKRLGGKVAVEKSPGKPVVDVSGEHEGQH